MKRSLIAFLTLLLFTGCTKEYYEVNELLMFDELKIGDRFCPSGGTKIIKYRDKNGDGKYTWGEEIEVAYVCNGRDGEDGLNAIGVIVDQQPKGVGCYVLSFYRDSGPEKGIVDEGDELITQTTICDGRDGQDGTDGVDGVDGADGADGADGTIVSFKVVPFPVSVSCLNGGWIIEIYLDEAFDKSFEVCNGVDGTDGGDGTDGLDGSWGDTVFTYEYTMNPDTCANGGVQIIVFADGEPFETYNFCYGMTVGASISQFQRASLFIPELNLEIIPGNEACPLATYASQANIFLAGELIYAASICPRAD